MTPKKRKFKSFYSEEEKKKITDELFKSLEWTNKYTIDKIIAFANKAINNPNGIEFLTIEDVYTKKVIEQIKIFNNVKKTAKFKALEKLPELLAFENEIIEQYSNINEQYIKRGICDVYEHKKYKAKKRESRKKKKLDEHK